MTVNFLNAQPCWKVRELDAATAFYSSLGFSLGYRSQDVHQLIHRDEVTIHLSTVDGGQGACQIMVDNVDELFGELSALGVGILNDGLGDRDRDWGCRDFSIKDPDENTMTFSQWLGRA